MRVVSRVGAGGTFVEDVLLEDDQEAPKDCVEARPPEGLHAPRWTGSAWVEGGPAGEVLASLKASKRAELEAAFDAESRRDFASAFAAAGVIAASPTDPRVGALKTRTSKLRDKLAAVDAATTGAGVGGVTWTP